MVKNLAIVITPAREWSSRLKGLGCESVEVVVEHDLSMGLARITEAARAGRSVTLVFVSLDTVEGGQAVGQVREFSKDARVVATGQNPDWRTIRLAFRAGADDFEFEAVEDDALAQLVEKYFAGTPVLTKVPATGLAGDDRLGGEGVVPKRLVTSPPN